MRVSGLLICGGLLFVTGCNGFRAEATCTFENGAPPQKVFETGCQCPPLVSVGTQCINLGANSATAYQCNPFPVEQDCGAVNAKFDSSPEADPQFVQAD